MKYLFVTILFFTLSQLNGQVNLTSGLAAYYPFNGNADDASGNGNNAIFNNATLTTGISGAPNSAYAFDGSSTYIRIASSNSLNVGSQITISSLVKVEGFYSGLCHGNDIINKGQYFSNPGAYILRFDDGSYTLGANCANPIPDVAHENFYGINTSTPGGYSPYIVLDEWHSVIYTYDGITSNMYIDGLLVNSNLSSGITFGNTDDLFIGRLYYPADPSLFPYWFNGVLDEVRIYNRAVNNQEIIALAQVVVLPVTITNFKASVQSPGKVNLEWSTENDDQIKFYTVERSYGDDQHFVTINSVLAKPGHNNNYTFTDNNIQHNINANYRLSISEKNGKISYSKIKTLKFISTELGIKISPNPSYGNINVVVNGYQGNATIIVYNITGQSVLTKKVQLQDGKPIDINLASQSKGSYKIKVQTGSGSFTKNFILQ